MNAELLPSTRPRTILSPGENCWTADAATEAAGVLIDARDYYRAFYRAARQAKRYILIAGWRFNSDVRLIRGKDAEETGGEVQLLPFLDRLCQENPDLEIYVLAWDFSSIFLHEWEWFLEWKFEWARPEQLHFRFDSEHPVGGSHHQKFVVIDGRVAFVGGLDFNADDWDDRRHLAHNPDRIDSGQTEPHKPYHDVQAYLAGQVAAELADYFCRRWRRGGGRAIELPAVPPGPLPEIARLPLPAGPVALSENRARTLTETDSTRQIRQLYLDAIEAAEELIFIENQYFSSQAVYRALLDRLRAPGRSKLDVVLILPKHLASWIESVTQGPSQVRMLNGLRAAAQETGHRLGAYYRISHDDKGEELPVIVHSKLLLVDDRFLTIGSANTSNRSMGLDTELNVSWEATSPADARLARAIRRVRLSLLSEHGGFGTQAALRQALRRRRGLVDVLDRLVDKPACRLRHLTDRSITEDRQWLELLARWGFSLDPKGPLVEETLFEPLESASSLLGRGLSWFADWLKGSERPAPKEKTPSRTA